MLKSRLFSYFFRGRRDAVRNPGLKKPELSENIKKWLLALPKAEIHLHFEGTIRAQRIYSLAKKYQVESLQTLSDAEWCLYFDRPEVFFHNFLFVSSLLRKPEDFYHAAQDLGRAFNENHIRYAEITLAPHKFIRAGLEYAKLMEAIDEGLWDTRDGFEREHRFIVDIVRDLGPDLGMDMMRYVEKYPHEKVVGIGLGGGENYPAKDSRPVFEYAKTLGLRRTAHAGEGLGAGSIWETIRSLEVERIDHGVRAREDKKLVDYLVEKQLPLNLCPTSNVILGVIPSLEEHPLRFYDESGIPVNVSTDDPAFFKTSLTEEYGKLIAYQKMKPEDIPRLIENALRASFLSDAESASLLQSFRDETNRLTEVIR